VNHTISYRLIQQAKATNQAIAIEYLTGIRERTNELPRSKTERRCSNSWALYQLRQFLAYKGVRVGVAVKRVASLHLENLSLLQRDRSSAGQKVCVPERVLRLNR